MVFGTEELGVVAALSVAGFRPERVRKVEGRARFEYVADEVETVVRAYYAGQLQVIALAYAEALRTAKGVAMNALPEVAARVS